jgi:uncharacterized protein YjbI with pentapeptide repeats
MSGISLRGQELDGLRMDDAVLSGADLRDTVWTDSRLRGAVLRATELDGADLRGADLGDFSWQDAQLLSGATISADQASKLLAQLGIVVD